MRVPRELRLPMKDDIGAFMKWLVEDASFGLFTFSELTRGIAWVLEQPYDLARALLVTGFVQGLGQEAVQDRNRVVKGKSVSVRVDLGGRLYIHKKTTIDNKLKQ